MYFNHEPQLASQQDHSLRSNAFQLPFGPNILHAVAESVQSAETSLNFISGQIPFICLVTSGKYVSLNSSFLIFKTKTNQIYELFLTSLLKSGIMCIQFLVQISSP